MTDECAPRDGQTHRPRDLGIAMYVATPDHAHEFDALQRCPGRGQGLEPSNRLDQFPEPAVIGLDPVVVIFRGAMADFLK